MSSQQIQVGRTCYLGDKCFLYGHYLIPDLTDYLLMIQKSWVVNPSGLGLSLTSEECSKN
jgi:hypothetical protein